MERVPRLSEPGEFLSVEVVGVSEGPRDNGAILAVGGLIDGGFVASHG